MRPKSTLTYNFDKIKVQLAELLKPCGFKSNRRAYYRVTSPGIVQVINLQRPKAPPNLFTVNLGISIEEVNYSIYTAYEAPKPNQVHESHCQIRARLGTLSGRKDYWWDLSLGVTDILADLGLLVLNEGVRFLDQFLTIDEIIDGFIKPTEGKHYAYPRISNIAAAAILLRRGDIETGVKLLKENISQSPVNVHHLQFVNMVCRKFGIEPLLAE
jgi:hypothetical protein